MTAVWIAFAVGLLIGATLGLFISCLLVAARRGNNG